jgi:hypothetical protein
MKKQTSKVSSVVMAGVVASALIGAVGGAVGWDLIDSPEVVTETVIKEVGIPYPVKGDTVIEYVDKEVIVEKEVPVDNGDMAFVLERLEDKDIIDDAEEIVQELKAEEAFAKGAFEFIESESKELFDLLEDKGIVEDEDEVEILKLYTDFEDYNITKADYDDEEFIGLFVIKVEDLDEETKHKIEVKVKLEDDEFEFVKVSEI